MLNLEIILIYAKSWTVPFYHLAVSSFSSAVFHSLTSVLSPTLAAPAGNVNTYSTF